MGGGALWLLLYISRAGLQAFRTAISNLLATPTHYMPIGRLAWIGTLYATRVRTFIICARVCTCAFGGEFLLGCVLGRDLIFSTWGASFGPGDNCYLPCDLNYPYTQTKFTKHPIPNSQHKPPNTLRPLPHRD